MIQLSIGVTSFAAEDPGTWEPLFRAARVADRAGVDRLVVSDHVVFGERLEEYGRPEIGGQAGGKQPTGPDGHWLEPLTTLAYLAGITTRVRLGTAVLLPALRHPVVLAHQIANVDQISRGRVVLGLGVGWSLPSAEREWAACGADHKRRVRRLEEHVEIWRMLWGGEPVTRSGGDATTCSVQSRRGAQARGRETPSPARASVPTSATCSTPSSARAAAARAAPPDHPAATTSR